MIGIVILGLGLVMVATLFPVAWGRARTLNEYTVQKAITAGSHATVKQLVHVRSPHINTSSFAGDLVVDPKNPFNPTDDTLLYVCDEFTSDTWVHALNLENIQVEQRRFVSEDTWQLEDLRGVLSNFVREYNGDTIVEGSLFRKQLSFRQREYPPMDPREKVSDAVFTGRDDRWDSALSTRRFCWSVFHRLRERIEPTDVASLNQALAATRSFDL